MDHASGNVHVKCTEGTELDEAAVAAAVEADPKFEVTEFTMHTAAAEPEEGVE